MKKIYFDLSFRRYPKKEVYSLAYELGRRLAEFLGIELFKLLLDSRILLYKAFRLKQLQCISDETYKLHPAAKALEGFLKKTIKGKKLKEDRTDSIGAVFGKKDRVVRRKIKDKRLIAKTKSVWDFCRNDIMHYSSTGSRHFLDMFKKYNEIIEIVILLYKDFYGKSDPDEKIKKRFSRYLK